MSFGKHHFLGDFRGNQLQPQGKHEEHSMPNGVGLIPLGDRNRDRFGFGDNVLEERNSVDISTSRRR
jgi:hypothetical protein